MSHPDGTSGKTGGQARHEPRQGHQERAGAPGLGRRDFLAFTGALLAGSLAGCGSSGGGGKKGGGNPGPAQLQAVQVFRLSSTGTRASNATKKNNANKIFRTALAAEKGRAHPGDRSRVVEITIPGDLFEKLFASKKSLVADLRHV